MHVDPPRGDPRSPDAFRGFYREHYGFVWHAVRRFGVATAEHGDAVQDTFITAYRRLDGFRGGSPRAWLYGIARRVVSNYRRSATRAARKHAAARDGLPSITPQITDALHTLDHFLGGLDDGERELFVLSEIVGLSGPEIAEALALRQGLVYSRLRLLRARISESAPDGLFAALCRVRADEPRPSARSWLVLAALLRPEPLAVVGSLGAIKLALVIVPLGLAATLAGAHAVTQRDRGDAPVVRDRSAAAVPHASSPNDRVDPIAIASTISATAEPSTAMPQPSAVPPATVAGRVDRSPRTAAPADASSLVDENAVLEAALSALDAGALERVLALTGEHTRRFPDSELRDISWSLRIDALCRTGKRSQARGEAQAFLQQHPRSVAAERVRTSCAASIATPPKTGANPDTKGA